MSPYTRLLTDPTLTLSEKLEDVRWRKTATPEEIARADALTALWYREKDAAERFREEMKALLADKFGS